MSNVDAILDANRQAVNDLIAASETCGTNWSAPRAPGKWSPSQVVEHVALSLEESANAVSGAPSKFPTVPSIIRPLVRAFVFNRVLKKGTFPKAKTNKAMNPTTGPATPAAARVRLDEALAAFARSCRARASSGQNMSSTVFGTVSVDDYARFIELHTRHHCKQMPGNGRA